MTALMNAGSLEALRQEYRGDTRLSRSEAEKVASQFEGLFVNLLLSRMKDSLEEGGFFGEAAGSQVQEGLFTSMLAEQVTTNGPGLGIAESLVEQWALSGKIRDDRPVAGNPYAKEMIHG